jgi:hypothetical protein
MHMPMSTRSLKRASTIEQYKTKRGKQLILFFHLYLAVEGRRLAMQLLGASQSYKLRVSMSDGRLASHNDVSNASANDASLAS